MRLRGSFANVARVSAWGLIRFDCAAPPDEVGHCMISKDDDGMSRGFSARRSASNALAANVVAPVHSRALKFIDAREIIPVASYDTRDHHALVSPVPPQYFDTFRLIRGSASKSLRDTAIDRIAANNPGVDGIVMVGPPDDSTEWRVAIPL
jgi:hypothetical protein